MLSAWMFWVFLFAELLLLLAFFLARNYIKSWISGSVKEHYQKSLEQRAHEHQVRLKAELVAELMAEWISAGADRKKLRELTNKAYLWLPTDIAVSMSELMATKSNIRVVDVLTKVRSHLLDEDNEFDPDLIVTFPLTEHEKKIREENDLK